MESADVTPVEGNPRGIARVRQPSGATIKNVKQVLFLAFVYNALGVPVAAETIYCGRINRS